jgi:hypothetical protein
MQIFLTIITLIVVFDTLLLIGVARLLVKLVQFLGQEEKNDRHQWASIIRERRALHLQDTNPANYADVAARSKVVQPSRHWDGIPKDSKNWDGLPQTDE